MGTSRAEVRSNGSGGFTPGTVVVTGATSGIGLATAVALRPRVRTLVLVGRDRSKLADAAQALAAGEAGGVVRTHLADLSRLAEVRRLAAELAAAYPAIDVLVNNAGAYFARRELTDEGVERTWALNVLAPYLLTRLLRDPLRAAARARVVNVSSAAHVGAKLDFDDLEASGRYSGFRVYGRSKLALILLTHEFARRSSVDHIAVNALHPGFVRSRFAQNNRGLTALAIRAAAGAFGISPKRGAATPVYLAVSPQVEGTTGAYFVRARAVRSSSVSYDARSAARLWGLCAERVGLPDGE
ncbi:MAG: SDR family NAD(P)-dependent oxidoreductase [Thermoplasmata archaeon]|nr:SDR family NAD(P)-dependent oxidoreductase [Thermoplasmata archaeon]